MENGSLRKTSYARPGKLFTANSGIMTKNVGDLDDTKVSEVILAVISVFEKAITK